MNIVLLAMTLLLGTVRPAPPGCACDLGALNRTERAQHSALVERLRGSIVHVTELKDGYRFTLKPGMTLVELATWASLERRCCPFFDIGIGAEHGGGPAWVQLGGSAEAKELVKGLLVKS